MTDISYAPPDDGALVTEDDLHEALAFLIAIEPDPDDETFDDLDDEACDALMRAKLAEGESAIGILRRYVQQRQLESLDAMRKIYHSLANDPRYLVNAHTSSVVTASLNEAWNGVGPWKR